MIDLPFDSRQYFKVLYTRMSLSGIDFFDVDHTITRTSSARHFAIQGIKTGVFPKRSLFYIPYYYLYYRYGKISEKSFERLFPVLRGIPKKNLDEISALCFERKLKKAIYEDARELIKNLQADGKKIVLATSSLDIIVKPIARYLEIDDIIATSLQFSGVDLTCTGNFSSAPIFKLEKKLRVSDYVQSHGLTLDQCSFYSDSVHDLPLLEAVGQPVIVNPDPRLKKIALQRSWPVIRFYE